MKEKHLPPKLETLSVPPGGGRAYALGPTMHALFKADGEETGRGYSVSEWRLEPGAEGPGAHSHDREHELFFVTEGVVSFRVGEEWIDAPRGAFLRVPPGAPHDFANRSAAPAAFLNVYLYGEFERAMPAIADWFNARERQD